MGTGNTNGASNALTLSSRDKVKEIASSLVKMAVNSMDGLKAMLADLKADGEKLVASLPGRAKQEVPNKSINSLLTEGVKFSDILKIVIGIALSSLTGNPIPLMLAEKHSKNLQERIKAKQKEVDNRIKDLNKQIREAKKTTRLANSAKLKKSLADSKQLKALKSSVDAKSKQADLAVKRAGAQATKKVSDVDKTLLKDVKSAFVKLGYKSTDAKKAAEIALSKSNSRDVKTILGLAIKEAAGLSSK